MTDLLTTAELWRLVEIGRDGAVEERAYSILELVDALQTRVAELEVDRWLLERFGVPGRGLSGDRCPPGTYGTTNALCYKPPGLNECPGALQCYRAWASRRINTSMGGTS